MSAQRTVTPGMKIAAFSAFAYCGFEVLIVLMMIRETAPAPVFVGVVAVETSIVFVLGLLMFRGRLLPYLLLGVYGIVRLLMAGTMAYGLMTQQVERIDPLLIMALVITGAFPPAWIVGAVLAWRARQRLAFGQSSAAHAR